MESVQNTDDRPMLPLPWRIASPEPGKCVDVESYGKAVCSFWGGDERHPQNFKWPTGAQKLAHAEYMTHACNYFPAMLAMLVEIANYNAEPEKWMAQLEELLNKVWIEGIDT